MADDLMIVEKQEPVVGDGIENDKPQHLFQQSDEDIAKQIRTWLKESSAAKSDALKNRKRDHRIHGGEHWSEADMAYAEKIKKPALTINLMLSLIAAIEGEERDNRKEIKFFGNEKTDDGAGFSLNRILKWIMKNCNGEFALSKAFKNAAICGQHWLGVEADFLEDPEGKICIVAVDDDEIFEDPTDLSEDLTKSRFLIRVKMWAEDEIEAKWPGKLDQLRMENHDVEPGMEYDPSGFKDIYLDPRNKSSVKVYDRKERRWAIIECWWHQVEPGVVVVNEQTGLLDEVSPEEFEEMKVKREEERQMAFQQRVEFAAMPQPLPVIGLDGITPEPALPPEIPPPLQSTERPVRRLYQAFQCVDVLLEKTASPFQRLKRFPYVPLRCMFNKDKSEYFGYIRPACDLNLQHNVEQSVIVQLMQLMPKNSFMAPKGAYHNKNDWLTKLAQPGALLEYNAQRGKPEPIPVPALPRHLIDMAFTRPQSIREVTGVNHELSGSNQGSNTGVVIDKRQKASRTQLTPFFDNYRMTKIELGKIILAFIQHFVTVGRQIRVIGDGQEVDQVIMTEEMQLGRFDITVDEDESGVNDRFEALYVLQTTLPQMIKAGVPVTPEFIDLLPLPPHIKKSWRRQIAWEMTVSNRLPPEGWQEGMPIPMAPVLGEPPIV